MQWNNKVLSSGFEINKIGFWTWTMWGKREKEENYDDSKDVAAIKYAIERGVTHFDAAELYAEGFSEEILWKAIKNTDRKKLCIASKVMWTNCSYEWVVSSCEKSLERCGLDYFDLYYIHWRAEDMDLKATMRALDILVKEWKIKNIWVCNFRVDSLKEAQGYTNNKIVVNQVHYNLICREPEFSGLLDYCQNNDVMIVAWRPLDYWSLISDKENILSDFKVKYWKSTAQIVLNWLISQDNVVTIFKSTNPEHIDENLWALNWEMEKEDIEYIRKNYPWQLEVSDTVPLK